VTERFGRTSDERHYICEALEAGVKGYVLKSWTFGDLIQATKQVSRGQPYFSRRLSAAVVCFTRIGKAQGSVNRAATASDPIDRSREID
jgi:DNA-binding NarL/FixJ family response regulator